MNVPNIRYYARFAETTAEGKKTPKYTIVEAVGYYPPMEQLRGRNGKISMNLMEKLKDGLFVPSMRLQAKNSLNFTGLKEWFVEGGKLSGFAYGWPLEAKTCSSKEKPNPFYEYRKDGYLFKVQVSDDGTKAVGFELLVLANAKPLIASYCKMFQMGGFDEALATIRQQAQ